MTSSGTKPIPSSIRSMIPKLQTNGNVLGSTAKEKTVDATRGNNAGRVVNPIKAHIHHQGILTLTHHRILFNVFILLLPKIRNDVRRSYVWNVGFGLFGFNFCCSTYFCVFLRMSSLQWQRGCSWKF